MSNHRRCGGSRVPAILGLCLAVVSASVVTAEQAVGESLRVCTFPAEGFFVRDAKGAPTGLEYDLLISFATAARLRLAFEDTPLFDQLLKDTQGGRCQIGAATVTVTAERKAGLAFSAPYFPNRVLVVQKTSSGFSRPDELKGRRVAVVKGTLSVSLVSGVSGVKPVLVESDDAAFQALRKGEAEALACDSAVVLHYLKKYPELGIAFAMGERSFFAFVLPKGSKFLGPLNEHLKSLSRSGAFTTMLAKHFGKDNAESLAKDVAEASARP